MNHTHQKVPENKRHGFKKDDILASKEPKPHAQKVRKKAKASGNGTEGTDLAQGDDSAFYPYR